MKKRMIWALCCALALLLTACATPEVTSGQGASGDSETSEASVVPLSEEELQAVRLWLTGTDKLPEQETLYGVSQDWSGRIGCFFTSRYANVRDLNLGAFLDYCAVGEVLEDGADDTEFQAYMQIAPWEIGDEDGSVRVARTLSEMPVPVRRFRVSDLNALLTEYADITVDDLHTDWKKALAYLPDYDSFYGGASDYAPGTFYAAYGEKSGNTVTLYEAEGGDVLTLKASGDSWKIVSHLPQGDAET